MWLLDTSSLELKEYVWDTVVPYAILSHTWGDDEVLFEDIQATDRLYRKKKGYTKVERFCREALRRGYTHGWVDSCCIDKRSSAELTEAINSMYNMYRMAGLCLIHLSDVPEPPQGTAVAQDSQWVETIRDSRWYRRGWTLQELIASSRRVFYACDWSPITHHSYVPKGMVELSSSITGIPRAVLDHRKPLREVCIAERMSWAARRLTTRSEDRAYSLMGIFDVNMPVLYGEGLQSAFRRLQEEILKKSFDQSLFAWIGPYVRSGLLARKPEDFSCTPPLGLWKVRVLAPIVMTNVGITIQAPLREGVMLRDVSQGQEKTYSQLALQCDVRDTDGWKVLAIRVERLGDDGPSCVIGGRTHKVYRRIDCDTFDTIPFLASQEESRGDDVVIVDSEHDHLMWSALQQHTSRIEEDHFGQASTFMKLGQHSAPLITYDGRR